MAIGSNNTTLNIDDVVATLLSEEMRKKSIEGSTQNTLTVRGQPVDRGEVKSSGKRSKSRGKSKARSNIANKSRRRCWGCDKPGHYKRDYTSTYSKEKSEKVQLIEGKTTQEKGDAYLASANTQSN